MIKERAVFAFVISVILFSAFDVFYLTQKTTQLVSRTTEAHVDVCIEAPPPYFDPDTVYKEATVLQRFIYQVQAKRSSQAGSLPIYYYDNTDIFEINKETGLIDFYPTYTQIGTHYINITARNGGSYCSLNLSGSLLLILHIKKRPWPDTNPPKVNLTLSKYVTSLNDTINVSCEAEDAESNIAKISMEAPEPFIDLKCSTKGNKGNCSARYKPSTAGTHLLSCEAMDSYGNKGFDSKELIVVSVANCSMLQEIGLDADISWNEPTQKVRLSWNSGSLANAIAAIQGAKITGFDILNVARCVGEECQGNNESAAEQIWKKRASLDSSSTEWFGLDVERLDFYKIITKIQLEEGVGSCKPEFTFGDCNGTSGWVDPCTGNCLKKSERTGKCEELSCVQEVDGKKIRRPDLRCTERFPGAFGCVCVEEHPEARCIEKCSYDATLRRCTGTCPTGQECKQKPTTFFTKLFGRQPECECQELSCSLAADKRSCVGSCPDPTKECKFFSGYNGEAHCECVAKTCSYDATLRRCVGTCPTGQECKQVDGKCECRIASQVTASAIAQKIPQELKCGEKACIDEENREIPNSKCIEISTPCTAPPCPTQCLCIQEHPEARCVEEREAYCCNLTIIEERNGVSSIVFSLKGWFDLSCEKLAQENAIEHLISEDANCGLRPVLCEVNSSTFAKFTQEIKKNENKTSINWIAHFIPADREKGKGFAQALDLFNKTQWPEFAPNESLVAEVQYALKWWNWSAFLTVPVFYGPYIAEWNASKQEQHGLAWGVTATELIPAIGPLKQLQPGMPYFISPEKSFNATWVGKLPEAVTFELKAPNITAFNENYIVLPLNTEIKTARDLCLDLKNKGLINEYSDNIRRWSVENQIPVSPTHAPNCWWIINIPARNFDLRPGEVLLVTVSNEGQWP